MMNFKNLALKRTAILLPLIMVTSLGMAQKKSKYACDEPNPEQLCNAGNTCGAPSQTCSVQVKRTANGASATPNLPGAKGNALFCIHTGATVHWVSDAKDTGFVIDLGPTSPFDPAGPLIGGADKDVPVVAKRNGCFKYTVGACKSGAIYGMCANGTGEVIVIK
jgi:hypothetical protein